MHGRRTRWLRVVIGVVAAGLVAAGLPVGLAAAEEQAAVAEFYDGPTDGGVPVKTSKASQFRSCPDPAPGEAYGTATPEEVGLDGAALEKLSAFHAGTLQRTLYVFRFGCLVKIGGLNPVFENVPQHQWSLTKGYSTAVIGRAVTMGFFDVHDTFGEYFPGVGDAAHQAVTAQQLLQHTSGVKMNWANEIPGADYDRVQAWANSPMEHKPGTYFSYSQNGPGTVNAMVEKAVQEHGYADFQDFAQRELFDKIGIGRDDYWWMVDAAGHTEGYAGLHLKPVDMARFTTLLQNRGSYRGEQLIDPSFLEEAATGSPDNPGFGYQTWINNAPWYQTVALNGMKERIDQPLIASAPNDMTYGWGWRGRHWFTMPKLGLMIVTTSMDHDFEYDPLVAGSEVAVQGEQMSGYHEFFRLAMAAVTDQEVPDPGPYTGREASLTAFNAGSWVDPVYTVEGSLTDGRLDPNKPGLATNAANFARVVAHNGPFVPFN
jgi:CubicO group peptidase (beta-lactamase class C family)